ncbi:hypothetical protein [Streptomyces niveus]|uniref:hypothetical protein n=1 Tax=Streptomyces niveus TaxID=193462 RepID=UPI0036D2924D
MTDQTAVPETPVPEDTLVAYHGSRHDDHGAYVLTHCTCAQCIWHYRQCSDCSVGRYSVCDAAGGGGFRYVLTDPDDAHHALKHVGRNSVTPTHTP